MFDELLESAPVGDRTRQRYLQRGLAILASSSLQCVFLLSLIIAPIAFTRTLPSGMLGNRFRVTALVPNQRPRLIPSVMAGPGPRRVARLLNHGVLLVPRAIPKDVHMIAEPEMPPDTDLAGAAVSASPIGDSEPGRLAGMPDGGEPVQSLVRRIMLGGQIEQAKLLEQSPLVYPRVAVLSHIEGMVVLHAIIDKDGNVSELQVVSGHPLLANSAMDAIRGWRYQATLLNGTPVEVDTTITVTFVLHKTAVAQLERLPAKTVF